VDSFQEERTSEPPIGLKTRPGAAPRKGTARSKAPGYEALRRPAEFRSRTEERGLQAIRLQGKDDTDHSDCRQEHVQSVVDSLGSSVQQLAPGSRLCRPLGAEAHDETNQHQDQD
jgi:hypothetical protein